MNLKEVYEIFYPGKCGKLPSVWKVPPKYRSKKEFFEELLPIEIRWLNYKIWNDKARRSRFLSDCKKEARYIAELRTYLFEHPWTISRIEGKAKTLLSGQISEECMNDRFLQIIVWIQRKNLWRSCRRKELLMRDCQKSRKYRMYSLRF